MKIFTDWGFTREGWLNGERGEYWVLAQAVLLLGFVVLPVYRPRGWNLDVSSGLWYAVCGVAAALALGASILLVKGLLDLGRQLTPLPYPKPDGQLVQSGVYGIVRHPIYSGVILGSVSWSIFQFSLSHLITATVLLVFLDAKARREEAWLSEKYPEYSDYRQRVKKLIPWVY